MEITVLGCSGGIGGDRHTTALLVDDDLLVDAGTGVMSLELDALAAIDRVFLTHTHLDHIVSLPLMVDSVGALRAAPVTVYGDRAALEILRSHVFNWRIWPDFFRIPTPEAPFLESRAVTVGDTLDLGAGRVLRVLPVDHTVPAVGSQITSPAGSLVFSGDTTCCDAFWEAVNAIDDLRYLIVETAFSENEKPIAVASKHLCPSMLASELDKFRGDAEVYVTHLKPKEEQLIMEQVQALTRLRRVQRLRTGMRFQL